MNILWLIGGALVFLAALAWGIEHGPFRGTRWHWLGQVLATLGALVAIPVAIGATYLFATVMNSDHIAESKYEATMAAQEATTDEIMADIYATDFAVEMEPGIDYDALIASSAETACADGSCESSSSSGNSNLFYSCPGGCTTPPPGCLIKGNVSFSSGERIYHVPGGEFYTTTQIDPEYGERWFCTDQEAIDAGWRKSSR